MILQQDSNVIEEFVERNEKILFHINTKITNVAISAWFVIEKEEDKNKRLIYRYRYPGDIMNGLDKYFTLVKHFKTKESE